MIVNSPFIALIAILSGAVILSVSAKRLNISPSAAYVIGGMALSFATYRPPFESKAVLLF